MDHGYTVIRFRYDADWAAICAQHLYLFGSQQEGG